MCVSSMRLIEPYHVRSNWQTPLTQPRAPDVWRKLFCVKDADDNPISLTQPFVILQTRLTTLSVWRNIMRLTTCLLLTQPYASDGRDWQPHASDATLCVWRNLFFIWRTRLTTLYVWRNLFSYDGRSWQLYASDATLCVWRNLFSSEGGGWQPYTSDASVCVWRKHTRLTQTHASDATLFDLYTQILAVNTELYQRKQIKCLSVLQILKSSHTTHLF